MWICWNLNETANLCMQVCARPSLCIPIPWGRCCASSWIDYVPMGVTLSFLCSRFFSWPSLVSQLGSLPCLSPRLGFWVSVSYGFLGSFLILVLFLGQIDSQYYRGVCFHRSLSLSLSKYIICSFAYFFLMALSGQVAYSDCYYIL